MMATRPCGIRWVFGFSIPLTLGLAVASFCGSTAAGDEGGWIDSPAGSVLIADGEHEGIAAPSAAPVLDAATLQGAIDPRAPSSPCPSVDYCPRFIDDQPGLCQRLARLHDQSGACWIGRADAMILWRNAPPGRLLVESGDEFATPILNANQLDSAAAPGQRFSLIRRDRCSGDAWEATYLWVSSFQSQRGLPYNEDFNYALASPGIFDNNASQPFDAGSAYLGGQLRSFELNRLLADGQRLRWLAGFRWVEWQENFSLQDANYQFDPPINDLYQSATINSLYGGQIGAELLVLTLPWLRVDSVVKAGAYYNNAMQRSAYTTDEFVLAGETVSIQVGQSPASCGFIGEVGMTGAIPLTNRIDFRFGYFALWLSGIAQPTQQLSGQVLVPGEDTSGSLATNGGVVVQGLTLGLEGRW